MGRPKKYTGQYIDAWRLWSIEGHMSAAAISIYLERHHEAPASRAQVRRWVTKFTGLPSSVVDLDRAFEWHRLDEYGVPWTASRVLLKVLNGFPCLTVREARWCWRVHMTAPEITELDDLVSVGRAFAERELRHDLLAEPLYLEDLIACLSTVTRAARQY
jgi:hypothetical protein